MTRNIQNKEEVMGFFPFSHSTSLLYMRDLLKCSLISCNIDTYQIHSYHEFLCVIFFQFRKIYYLLCCGKLIFTNKFSTGNFLVKCTNKCKILYLQSMKTFDQVCIYSKLFCRFELRIAIATKIFF